MNCVEKSGELIGTHSQSPTIIELLPLTYNSQ